jgi:hypothetical protein
LQAGGVAAELLKTGIADGDGAPRAVKLKPHRILLNVCNLGPGQKKCLHGLAL